MKRRLVRLLPWIHIRGWKLLRRMTCSQVRGYISLAQRCEREGDYAEARKGLWLADAWLAGLYEPSLRSEIRSLQIELGSRGVL